MPVADPTLTRFRAVVAGAIATLEARRDEVNDLNVFPIADGDTGDNMTLTLRAVLAELDALSERGQVDEIGREELVSCVARAALLGARGNSGVIISQLIRGAAEELASRPGELVDPVLVGAALARAADRAYASVRNPAEGTILTVMREMAHGVASALAHMAEPRLEGDHEPSYQDGVIADVLERALAAGQDSVRRGPDLLPALREAGVVDAGGYALTIIFAGVIAALRGGEPPEVAHQAPPKHLQARPTGAADHASATFRYCTNFAVTGVGLQAASFAVGLEALGDCVLVVGDAQTLKVHLHTDAPEAATALFAEHGVVSRLDVADMRLQVAERAARLAAPVAADAAARSAAPPTCGVLAVVSGAGMAGLFSGLGAMTLDGGETMNPSTEELLNAIEAHPAASVLLLPNSPNVIMAAERAVELAAVGARVIPSRSPQAGLVAAVAADPDAALDANALAMADALEAVRTGAVAEAGRDDANQRFRQGEAVGFVDDALIAWGEPESTLRAVVSALARESELVTVIVGAGAPLDAERVEGLVPPGVELELERGDQPSHWWLIAAE